MSKPLAPSKVTTRDSKGLKFVAVVEAAYNKAGLTEEEAQRVNETLGLADLVTEFIAQNRSTNKYKDEEVRAIYGYPKEYKGPKPINDQIKAIAEIFGLDSSHALEHAKNLPALPDGAEGWFAVPSVDAVCIKHFSEIKDPAEKYVRVLQMIHQKIAAQRSFHNYREGKIRPTQLRVHARTAHALDLIVETQKGDILIIAAQLGMRHRGRSVRYAREVFVANEYGLTSVAVGSIVLVHPERLTRWEELDIDCPGDEFSVGDDGSFDRAPYWCFGVSAGFGVRVVSSPYAYCGSASGFISQ